MARLFLYQGTYPEVFNAFSFDVFLGDPSEKRENTQSALHTVSVDLPRTAYYSKTHTLDLLKEKLYDAFSKQENIHYLQGDLSGGLGRLITVTNLLKEHEKQGGAFYPEDIETDDIHFCYTDQDNVFKGFMFLMQRDLVSKNTYHFSITFYKNICDKPDAREIIHISCGELLDPEQQKKGKEIQFSELPSLIQQNINDRELSSLIQQLLNSTTKKSFKKQFDVVKSLFPSNNNAQSAVRSFNSRRSRFQSLALALAFTLALTALPAILLFVSPLIFGLILISLPLLSGLFWLGQKSARVGGHQKSSAPHETLHGNGKQNPSFPDKPTVFPPLFKEGSSNSPPPSPTKEPPFPLP